MTSNNNILSLFAFYVFEIQAFALQGTLNFFSTHTYDDKNTHQYDSYSPFNVSFYKTISLLFSQKSSDFSDNSHLSLIKLFLCYHFIKLQSIIKNIVSILIPQSTVIETKL